MPGRVVSWFSCGAASAVATKLALAKHPDLIIAYTEVLEEHPDNRRFFLACQHWFGREILVLGNDDYGRSIYEVFRKVGYIQNDAGAPCTRLLKKEVRRRFQQPGDVQVFGYTADKKDAERVERLLDGNPEINAIFPLIEAGLAKADVLAMVERAGIKLPEMYKLGYQNNNCIGCVKGAVGYWNKIRGDFPQQFEHMAATEETLGAKIVKREWNYGGERKLERLTLRQLSPETGHYPDEPDIECSILCLVAESIIKDGH